MCLICFRRQELPFSCKAVEFCESSLDKLCSVLERLWQF